MNIKCLFGRHVWRFAYHHGMPLGINGEDAMKMLKEDKTYPVDVCIRRGCGKQSRTVNGKRVMLHRDEIETP